MAVSDWSTTAASNTTVGGISIAENCDPGNLNDAIREVMAQVKAFSTTVASGGAAQPVDATLTALAAVVTSANKLIYATGSDAFATTDLTAFGRGLIGAASAETARTTLGISVSHTASSFANPGYIKLNINGTEFMVQWGVGTLGADSFGSITYSQTYSAWSVCVVSGGPASTATEGDIHTYGSATTTGAQIVNSANSAGSYHYIAVGV